jgi:hypothetical protein
LPFLVELDDLVITFRVNNNEWVGLHSLVPPRRRVVAKKIGCVWNFTLCGVHFDGNDFIVVKIRFVLAFVFSLYRLI